MLKKLVPVLAATALITTIAVPSARAFDVGGTNGWKLSTDGIVDVFSVYQTTTANPNPATHVSLLNGTTDHYQDFNVMVGLLPSVVGLNITAPTTNGVDSTVRVGIYPSIQSTSTGNNNRFSTNPNIDFREIFYTAKGSYGEILAGRALNLYQGKNILTDMTLLTAGTIPAPGTTTTLGHIGYGYLYTNFGPQMRYTTPSLGGVKVAVSVNAPNDISSEGGDKTSTPQVETEISYAGKFGDATLQAWGSAMYQSATRANTAAIARPNGEVRSLGGALGAEAGFGGLDLVASGYYGQGLGMVSVQDGSAFGNSATDSAGQERTEYGYLVQATYKLNPTFKIGVNYGQNGQEKNDADKSGFTGIVPTQRQESAVGMLVYNFNSFTQFVAEAGWAQNTWFDGTKQHSNSFDIGTMFYW